MHTGALALLVSIFEGKIGRTIAVNLISASSYEISQESILVNTKLGPSWMDPIVIFIRLDKLLEYKREAHKLWIKVAWFWISPTGDLYKR